MPSNPADLRQAQHIVLVLADADVYASRSASLSDTQRMLARQCRAEEMGTSQPGCRCGSRLQGWRAGTRKYRTTISEFRFSAPPSMGMGKPSVIFCTGTGLSPATSALGLGSPLLRATGTGQPAMEHMTHTWHATHSTYHAWIGDKPL